MRSKQSLSCRLEAFRHLHPLLTVYPIQTVGQLGPYLKSLRQARGWTQAALAGALGVSRARVNTIERDPGAVSVAQLHRVLTVLGARLGIEAAAASPAHGAVPSTAPSSVPSTPAPGRSDAPARDPSPTGEW